MERVVTEDILSPELLNEMEEARIDRLNKAGINEEEKLHNANEHQNIWTSYFNENITRGKDDINFLYRDQWTAVERSEFTRLFKPAMTFNKLYDVTKKIAGEQRKNKPDLIVRSLTGKASQEQINLRADLLRTYAYQSQNDLIYQTSFLSALSMGYGAFQITLDYESPRSFRQVPRYDLITDPTRCSWDPSAIKPHKGDGNWCSRNFVFTRDQFEATYPYVTNPVPFVDAFMLLDPQWTAKDTIIVHDEFTKEWYPLIIYQLSNGQVVDDDEWEGLQKDFAKRKEVTADAEVRKIIEKEMPYIVNKRQTQDYRIMHYRMIRDQIIDFSEWPSKHLPIPFVDGDSQFIEGRQYTKSFIHEARDSQKCINYFNSEIAGEIKNRRREQWLATPDNIIGYEQQWRNPELQQGALMAKPDPKTGQMPIKMPAWEISQGLMQNVLRATQDMREILGFSEAEQLQGRDISGTARRERKMEGSMSAYVFFDNLNQAVEQGGRVVNDLITYVMGEEERHVNINKKDGRSETIIINAKNSDGMIENTLGVGDFDVEIDTGPSFSVQKEVALEFLQTTLQAFPQAFPLVADLWAKNLDVQFMPQMAERFKTLVPPEILAKEDNKPMPAPKPDPQAMIMQQEMAIKAQKMQIEEAALRERAEELKIRQEKHELEKAELIMKAKEMAEKMGIEDRRSKIDLQKADLDFTSKIAKILADSHKDAKRSAV